MTTPASHATNFADRLGGTRAPQLSVGPHRGRRRGEASGSCLMEYVSMVAGERFSDLPKCTHPAVAVVAWRINDELRTTTRQQLLRRAPALVGAGRGLSRPVRPIVLGVIADAALALDPHHRYFRRLRRRLDRSPLATDDDTGGRLALCWRHLVLLNMAMTQFLWVVSCHSANQDQSEQCALNLLDACLAAVQTHPTSPSAALSAC